MQKHLLISYLDELERDPTKDFLLVMPAKYEYIEFFKKQNNEARWKERLESLKGLDLTLSPLFEAIWFFGEWKIEKNYEKGIKSAQKFEETEKIAYEKNWFCILAFCLETTIYIYRTLGYTEQLKLVSKRIIAYLKERKETLPARIAFELTRLFNGIMNIVEKDDLAYVYEVLIEFSERMQESGNFNFQRSFLFEAIKIADFLKKAEEKQLNEKVIQSWINEAQEKGKTSNLIKYYILQQALDYSVRIGNKEKTQQLKKELAGIDFSDELKEIALPEPERERFVKILKEYYEKLRESIRKYINGISNLPPVPILLNVCNDESIIRINLKETKKFVQELIRKHPLQHIFGTILCAGEKIVRLESIEEKEKFQLNQQLNFGVNETIWITTQIFKELHDRNLFSLSAVADFLSRCSSVNKNNFELVMYGVKHHFQGDYVASISILMPLIESILFDYLRAIGADVSSYEGKIIEQRELGGLINLKEFKENFGEDFQHFLKLLLVEADSFNFRNRFAHGNVAIEEFNERTSSIILFIILKICSKTFNSR